MDHPSAANPPSEKTISDIFKRLGRCLFHRLVEPSLVGAEPTFAELRRQSAEAYEIAMDALATAMVSFAMKGLPYEHYRVLKDSASPSKPEDVFNMEIRQLSAKRQGIKSDARADIGLSQFRMITALEFAKGKSADEQVDFMLKTLLDWLLYEPLDEDGNTSQLFRKAAPKFPYGSFCLPEPSYITKRNKT